MQHKVFNVGYINEINSQTTLSQEVRSQSAQRIYGSESPRDSMSREGAQLDNNH